MGWDWNYLISSVFFFVCFVLKKKLNVYLKNK